jgi:hypothetical protein
MKPPAGCGGADFATVSETWPLSPPSTAQDRAHRDDAEISESE